MLPPQSKSIAQRLGGVGRANAVKEESVLEAEERRRKEATKLFKKEEAARSRIYQALNPQKLWYESPRQREDADGEDDDSGPLKVSRAVGV